MASLHVKIPTVPFMGNYTSTGMDRTTTITTDDNKQMIGLKPKASALADVRLTLFRQPPAKNSCTYDFSKALYDTQSNKAGLYCSHIFRLGGRVLTRMP